MKLVVLVLPIRDISDPDLPLVLLLHSIAFQNFARNRLEVLNESTHSIQHGQPSRQLRHK